jgi:hypothetical protein
MARRQKNPYYRNNGQGEVRGAIRRWTNQLIRISLWEQRKLLSGASEEEIEAMIQDFDREMIKQKVENGMD